MTRWSGRGAGLRVLILLGICLLSSVACQKPLRPTPVTERVSLASPSATRSPTPQQPTLTVTGPTGTPTIVALPPTATSKPLPSPSPIPTTTPTPTPSQTLAPDERLATAERAMMDGDYPVAIELWQEALRTADRSQQAALELSLARAFAEEGRHRDAIFFLTQAVTDTVTTGEQIEALGLLARCHEALGEWRAAIDAFERYLEVEDAAEPYVRWHLAKALEALGEDEQAIQQLVAIDFTDVPLPLKAEMLEENAVIRRRLGDYDGALEAYEQILGFSRHENYRALILQKQGDTLREAEKETESVEMLQRVVDEHPQSYAAYLALLSLDDMDAAKVTDLQRGEILYHAGEYADCLKVLRRYEYANPEGDLARAHYDIGLAYERQGEYARAFQEYDLVIEHYPQDRSAPDAWMAKARAAAAYGGDPSGLYHEFWRRFGDDDRAPDALWLGGLALERQGAWARAAEFYARLRAHYPENERANEALFREALAAHAIGDAGRATELWESALQGEPSLEERSRILTWLGLTSTASGEADQARSYWEEAIEASPWSYYGLRARDLSAGLAPRLPPTVSSTLPDGLPTESDWRRIGRWVHSWSAASEGDQVERVSDSLVRRGEALLRIGWHQEGITTFRLLRDRARADPDQLVALARLSLDRGLYSLSISCAERLAELGRQEGGPEPPESLMQLAYPTTFGHLITAESRRYAVDPLLFLALVRQESRFDPRAVSYAGATGLAQVMPSTGTWIASRIGPEVYRQDFLSRPVISVRYGLWFLSTLLDLYDRDWIAALVAYNAGPGNLKRWTDGQPIQDHDLFYETIPGAQAKEYVREVYRQYRMYERIYSSRTPG